MRISTFGEDRRLSELVRRSPERLVTDETPPMIFVHVANDRVVLPQNPGMLFRALKAKGVQAELHIFRTGGHSIGAGYDPTSPQSPYPGLMQTWIKRQVF